MTSKQPRLNFLKPDDEDAPRNISFANDQLNYFIFNSHHSLPIEDQRARLPIRKYRDHLLYCVENYQTVILIGETGCGKSTQIPQYLYEQGWHLKGLIGVTEPRHVAIVTLAGRVALERGELVGNTVGYADKFIKMVSPETHIKYMTEANILRELLADPLLTRYSVIVVDEAHERSFYTDMLLGLLKKIISKRPSLKLIISSATIDAEFFKDFFSFKDNDKSSVVLSVEGRMHPVNIFYLKAPCADYVRESTRTIFDIIKKEPPGDILVFLADQDEILEAHDIVQDYISREADPKLQVVTMYEGLSTNEQLKVFLTPPHGIRKIVLATNIAETSVTVPGILYVIDCGFTKIKWFNAESYADNYVVVPISKASAIQRAGRAGRIRSGKVYRLYTEEDFGNLPDRIPPEMRRAELSPAVLHLKALGINNILRFHFPCAPPAKNLLATLETLYALEAINEQSNLTRPVGYMLAEMPLPPMLAKMLYMSGQMACSEEILSIIAMLQVQTVFSKTISPKSRAKARVAKRNFEVAEGDLITLLNVYTAFIENGRTKEFCGQYFLVYRHLKYACEIRAQLSKLANEKFGIPLISAKGNIETICKCITAGLFVNAAYLHHSGNYRKLRGDIELSVHPASSLYTVRPSQYVVYCELVQTTKAFMRNLTVIKDEWLTELAPHYYHRASKRNLD